MNYCFQTEALYSLFVALFPEERDRAHTLDSFLGKLVPTQSKNGTDRLKTLTALLEENHLPYDLKNPGRLLLTLEKLRESFILSQEHLDHCFLSIPPTPKNMLLKAGLILYLNSPLAVDATRDLWNGIEVLKNKAVTQTFPSEWVFVKEGSGNLLFEELAKAFTYAPGVTQTQVVEFWKTEAIEPAKMQPILWGSDVSLLESLAANIAQMVRRDPEPVLVPFFGSPEKVSYLKYRLISLGLTVSEVGEAAKLPPTDSDFLARLRNCKEIPFATRLALWHSLKNETGLVPTTVPLKDVVERLLLRTEMPSPIKDSVRGLLDGKEAPTLPAGEKAQVWILPWTCAPVEGKRQVAYCDESLLHPERNKLLLTYSETESLFLEGFSLPRTVETREFRLNVLKELVECGAQVYSSLEKTYLEGFEVRQTAPTEIKTHTVRNPEVEVSLTPSYFSATQLEAYAICPAKYLYSNRFRFRKEMVSDERIALLFGQCTHLALETFFAKGTHAASKEEWPALLTTLFNESVTAISPELDVKHNLFRLLKEMFKPIALSVPRMETELSSVFGMTTPLHFEKDFKIDFQGKSLVGKIDRIDTLPDGSLLVIDYKTGTVDFSPEHIKKGDHFQALIYLHAAEILFNKNIAGVLFYDLKKSELRRGIFQEAFLPKDSKKLLTRGHTFTEEKVVLLKEAGFAHLQTIAKNISDGVFSATPSADACRYCDFRSFCRSAYGAI